MKSMGASRSKRSLTRARLVLPLFLAGVAIAGFGLLLRSMTPREASASAVRKEISRVIDRRGTIGPFYLQAESFDPARGEFTNFHAETDDLMIGARRAVLHVNAATDTVQFELFSATILRVPEGDADAPVMSQDRYILGPFEWKLDIVDDDGPVSVLPE